MKENSVYPISTAKRFTRMTNKLKSATALLAALSALALGGYLRRQAPQPVREPPTTVAAESESPYQFLLKSQKQGLELFHLRDGDWQKLAEFPLTLGDLPETDRRMLRTGLALRDAAELQRSLEDYLPNE